MQNDRRSVGSTGHVQEVAGLCMQGNRSGTLAVQVWERHALLHKHPRPHIWEEVAGSPAVWLAGWCL